MILYGQANRSLLNTNNKYTHIIARIKLVKELKITTKIYWREAVNITNDKLFQAQKIFINFLSSILCDNKQAHTFVH